jgi:hypothetical protein
MSGSPRKLAVSPSAAPATATPTTTQPPATPHVVVGLPGQALFNRHYDTMVSVYHFVARALGAALLLLGVAKASNADWGRALFGEIRLISAEAEVEPGSDEEGVYRRGGGLLIFLLGVQIIGRTIPARKQQQQGGTTDSAAAATAAAAGSGPKAGKAE